MARELVKKVQRNLTPNCDPFSFFIIYQILGIEALSHGAFIAVPTTTYLLFIVVPTSLKS